MSCAAQKLQKRMSGGLIRGPGTATSDSIRAAVPVGSYILPADTTRALGLDQQGAGAGFPEGRHQKKIGGIKAADPSVVSVQLSNGEYQVAPEQLQQLGAQLLDRLRQTTHVPAFANGGQVRGMRALANGGTVDYYADQDGSVSRRLNPRDTRSFIVDQSGSAQVRNLPATQSGRQLIPVSQPVTISQSTDLAPVRSVPSRPALPAPSAPGRADFYAGGGGSVARGMRAASSSYNPMPAAPAGNPALPPPQGKLPAPAPRAEYTPDYKARAESMWRAKRDSAAWQAQQQAENTRWYDKAAASGAAPKSGAPDVTPAAPRRGLGAMGAFGAAANAIPGIVDTWNVATDKNSTGLDTANQASQEVARAATSGLGGALGARAGAALGAGIGGIAGPIGSLLGGIAGSAAGYYGTDKLIQGGRRLLGLNPDSPAEQIAARQQQGTASQALGNRAAPAIPAIQPQSPLVPAAPSADTAGWTMTNVPGVATRKQQNGIPAFTNDAQQVAAAVPAMSGRPANLSYGQPGDAARAIQAYANASAIRSGAPSGLQASLPRPDITVVGQNDSMDRARERRLADIAGFNNLNSRAARNAAAIQLRQQELAQNAAASAADLGLRQQALQDNAASNAANLSMRQQELGASQQLRQQEAYRQAQDSQINRLAAEQKMQADAMAAQGQKRIYDLQQAYLDAKTPQEQARVAQQIQALSGKGGSDSTGGDTMLKLLDAYSNLPEPPRVGTGKDSRPMTFQEWAPGILSMMQGQGAGNRLVGHSNGRPVYQDPQGNLLIDE